MRFNFSRTTATAGLFLGIAFGILAMSYVVKSILDQSYQDDYGNALAKLTARYITERASHEDLVAQQALISELLGYPHVKIAAIYDPKDKLLVQAGDKNSAPSQISSSFKAPIKQHGALRGYLVVTLLHPKGVTADPWPYIIGLGTTFCLFSLFLFWRSGVIENPPKQKKVTAQEEIYDEEPINEAPEPVHTYASLQIKNAAVLKQQLSASVYKTTLKRVEKVISDVLALYNGSEFERIDDKFYITFNGEGDLAEAAFRAVCGTHLITELTKVVNNIPLDISSFISTEKNALKENDAPVISGVALDTDISFNEFVSDRVKLKPLEDEKQRQYITGFSQAVKALLDEQYKQLIKAI